MDLIIVESPTKVRTIKRYLSGDYDVVASMGHLRDLPKSKLGVDIENDFAPQYVNIKDKSALIKDIQKKAKKADHVYLAGDPDREGEAISWHLAQILGLDMNDDNRVTFNEITESGIKAGMSHPRKIDLNLVNAQQTRRILEEDKKRSLGRKSAVGSCEDDLRQGRGDKKLCPSGILVDRCEVLCTGREKDVLGKACKR